MRDTALLIHRQVAEFGNPSSISVDTCCAVSNIGLKRSYLIRAVLRRIVIGRGVVRPETRDWGFEDGSHTAKKSIL